MLLLLSTAGVCCGHSRYWADWPGEGWWMGEEEMSGIIKREEI